MKAIWYILSILSSATGTIALVLGKSDVGLQLITLGAVHLVLARLEDL